MPARIFGLDSTRTLIALKTCAAIIVGYGLALRFEWNASFVATTIIVLQTATWGATLTKASLRLAGTFAGALVGLGVVALCAQDRELFIVAMALVVGVCVWRMQSSTHQYAWMLVVVTSAIVGWPTAMNPLNAFQSSVDRVTAVTVGVILSSLAQGVFLPVTATAQFERTMREIVEGCRDLVTQARRGRFEHDRTVTAMEKTKAQLFGLTTSLETTLQNARTESNRLHRHFTQYEQLCDELEQMSVAVAAICDARVQCTRELPVASVARSPDVRQAFDSVDRACSATLEQLSMPRDGSFRPTTDERVSPDHEAADRNDDGGAGSQGTAAIRLLDRRIRAVRAAADRVRMSLASAEAAGGDDLSEPAHPTAAPAFRVRLAKSSLASLQVFVGAWFFILLDWPLGLQSAMVLVMIVAFMNAQLPVALGTRTILLSVAAALPVAAVFHFLVMPSVDTFGRLAPRLALLFFPFLYAVASRDPRASLAAIVSVMIAKSLISVSTTPPSYHFASFANIYLGMSGGFSLILLLAYLFETRSPRRGLHKLLSCSLLDAADYLKKLTGQPASTSSWAALAARYRQRSLRGLAQMKQLSAVVDYQQDPSIARGEIQSVLRSLDGLVMRLASAESLIAVPESRANDLKRAHTWCVESLAATGRALGAFQPVSLPRPTPGTPDRPKPAERQVELSEGTVERSHDTATGRTALDAYYRSLADAVFDCQRKLESVNWKRWCQDYF